jgi:hypothetical protein
MAKRGIDMLPLLDVFMVVLFVFATIQEQQLDSSAQELDDATTALATAEEVNAVLIEQLAAMSVELAGAEAAASARSEGEAKLREQLDEYLGECGPRQPGGPACPAANSVAKTAAEVVATHQRLLSKLAVFEIQLDGEPDLETGKLRTRCCYRAQPPEGAWQACGEVPSDALERRAWLDAGADGLVDGLADTDGSAAVVLLSQDRGAKFMVSDDLADLLRARFPDHRIYADGSSEARGRCPVER